MSAATTLTVAPYNRTAALRAARAILRHHGKSYYFSTCLFPRELQQSTCALYAFVRLPDEIVDNAPQQSAGAKPPRVLLEEYLDGWSEAYRTEVSSHQVLQLAAETFHKHAIPFEYSEAFLRAMIQDTEQSEYEDYADLDGYMYGSAACVGLMMSYIIGFSDLKALEHARQLGNAMQLTNFLRDIDEDYQERQRVYMPQDELAKFGLSTEDIAARRFSPAFKEFMVWQAGRCERMYDEANKGIAMLNPEGRFAVATASTLYRAILGRLEKQDWNPFAGRASTSFPEKLVLLAKAKKISRS